MSTPIGALTRGLVAGAIGTGVMTAYQLAVAKAKEGASDDAPPAEPDAPADPWEGAPAPAQLARRVIEGVFQRDVGPERIGTLTNVTHWGYGVMWGGLYGLLAGSAPRTRPLPAGVAFGTGVWASSYAALVPMGLYEPPWTYPPAELATDASYHVVYGVAVAAAWRLLGGR